MKSGRYFTILPARGPIVYYVANKGGGGTIIGLILGVNFENAQNVSAVEILTHRTGILCKSCQTYIIIEQFHVSLKIRQKKIAPAAPCRKQNFTRIKLGPGTYQLFLLPGM